MNLDFVIWNWCTWWLTSIDEVIVGKCLYQQTRRQSELYCHTTSAQIRLLQLNHKEFVNGNLTERILKQQQKFVKHNRGQLYLVILQQEALISYDLVTRDHAFKSHFHYVESSWYRIYYRASCAFSRKNLVPWFRPLLIPPQPGHCSEWRKIKKHGSPDSARSMRLK